MTFLSIIHVVDFSIGSNPIILCYKIKKKELKLFFNLLVLPAGIEPATPFGIGYEPIASRPALASGELKK